MSDDHISQTRAIPDPDPTAQPTGPANFLSTSAEIRKKQLRHFADGDVQEVIAALRQCASRGDQMSLDFGQQPNLPTPKAAAALADRIEKIQECRMRLASQDRFLAEAEEIARSDAADYAFLVHDEVEHFSKKNAILTTEYSKVETFARLHSDAIRKGKKDAQHARESLPASTAPKK